LLEVRVGISWLDVKLGLRMLIRYPGLSFAGGFGIAMVVVCGTAAAVFDAVVNGTLPFEQGDRVVAIENWDTRRNQPESRALHDLDTWRTQLTSIQDIGAYRFVTRNLTVAGRPAEPVLIAEISASAFRIARVPPRLGRHLVAGDERDDAPPVIVIGHDEWQRRFDGDPRAIGRTLQIADTTFTIVGVMPEGFGFPVRESYWIPLRLKASDYARATGANGRGPEVFVFGRIADGDDFADARAELELIGRRAAADFPETHAHLRPRVMPYTQWYFASMQQGETRLMRSLVLLLLGVVGANVAVLIYARTAPRRTELALRSALGASRGRIVGQMFAEGLVLSAAAAAAGLTIAAIVRTQLDVLINQAPFWVNTSITSGPVIMYALVLTVLGAVIVGVIPALQATSRRAQTGLQYAASTPSRWKIGHTYSLLIVAQVALAVTILPTALSSSWLSFQYALVEPGFAADEFLTARIAMDREALNGAGAAGASARAGAGAGTSAIEPGGAASAWFRDRQSELARRLMSEPGVSAVTLLIRTPGDEPRGQIEIEGDRTVQVGISRLGADAAEIGADPLDAFGIPVLAGRKFDMRDLTAGSNYVLVNRTFAERILGGNAIGRRIREARARASDGEAGGSAGARDAAASGPQPGPWLEIAGVIGDFPTPPDASTSSLDNATVYWPVARGDVSSIMLAVRIRGGAPLAFATRLREIVTALDRGLQLDRINSMDALLRNQQIEMRMAAVSSGMLTMSVLLLSATGLYALMSFTVTQRRRDIAIRVSLGASQRRILGGIVFRAMAQLVIGILIGVAIVAPLEVESGGELTGGLGLVMLPVVATFVLLIGVIAAVGPARRGLGIQPIEALREQ
jgi:putative ABC transport system permease protein